MASLQNKLTPQRREEIQSAMEASNGVKKDASKILKCTPATLAQHIKRDDVLRAKYDPTFVPEVVDSEVHRPVDKDQITSIALAKEEATLVGGWEQLGITTEETEYLARLATFTNGKLDQVIDFTYGGMVHNSTMLSLLVGKTMETLKDIMENPASFHEMNDDGAITYSGFRKMKEMNSSLLEIMKEMRATNAAAEQTMITRAKIDEIKRVKEEANKTGVRKPGFLGVTAAPNLTQHVTNNKVVEGAVDV